MIKTPLEDWIRGKISPHSKILRQNDLEDYQLQQLRQTVKLCKEKSRFYKQSLAAIDPDEIRSFSTFAQLPFTLPQDIQENPLGFLCISQSHIERIVSLQTSGTTGRAKRVFFTKEDQDLTIDFFDYGMRNLVGPKDRVLILLPGETPGSVGDLLRIGLERMGAYPIPFGPVYNVEEAIGKAITSQATSIVGIPVQVLNMARHQKGSLLKGKIKTVLLSTDYVPESIVQGIEEKWKCQVFNHYGMTEMGLGGGVQCSARRGYHLREADLYFEIIDPGTGEVLPEGELGEIVFTTLTRKGMPLIRYRTGDLSRFISAPCPCGSVLRSMEVVKGRVSGKKRLGEGDISIPQLDEVLFSIENVLNYQCQIEEREGTKYLYINLLLAEESSLLVKESPLSERESSLFGRFPIPTSVEEVVHRALGRIPVIRAEIMKSRLKIIVNTDAQQFKVTTGTAKRQIIDKRY